MQLQRRLLEFGIIMMRMNRLERNNFSDYLIGY